MKYKAVRQQTVFDLATQFYGDAKFAPIVAEDNGIQVTDDLTPGSDYEIRDDMVRYFTHTVGNGFTQDGEDYTIPDKPVEGEVIEDGGHETTEAFAVVDGGYEGQVNVKIQDGNI